MRVIFVRKEKNVTKKGSIDKPIGLKITTLLADQSGNRPRARDVMLSATGALAKGGG